MGRSSLLGAETAALEPAGRDTASLGPGDNSDSGSDVAGLEQWSDAADPAEPVDVMLRLGRPRSVIQPDVLSTSSDAAGTGERGSASPDRGFREAADISMDQVFDTTDDAVPLSLQGLPDADAWIDPDPEGTDALELEDEEDATDAEADEARHRGEDESADPVGDGHSDAELARRLRPGI